MKLPCFWGTTPIDGKPSDQTVLMEAPTVWCLVPAGKPAAAGCASEAGISQADLQRSKCKQHEKKLQVKCATTGMELCLR